MIPAVGGTDRLVSPPPALMSGRERRDRSVPPSKRRSWVVSLTLCLFPLLATAAQAAVSQTLLLELRLTSENLAAAGLNQQHVGSLLEELDGQTTRLAALEQLRADLSAAQSSLSDANRQLASAGSEYRARLANLETRRGEFDQARAAYHEALEGLRQAAIEASLPSSLAQDLALVTRTEVITLPPEYRVLGWTAGDLYRLNADAQRLMAGDLDSAQGSQALLLAEQTVSVQQARIHFETNHASIRARILQLRVSD